MGPNQLHRMRQDHSAPQEPEYHEPIQQQQQFWDYYVQEHITDYTQDRRNAVMRKNDLQSVRAAVQQVMPQVYTGIDHIRMQDGETQRRTKLHHSRGMQLGAAGTTDVLEFDIAGSSFKQFRSEHIGFKGKGDSSKDYMKYDMPRLAKLFSWIPGCKRRYKKRARRKAKENLQKLQNGTISRDDLSEKEQHNVDVLRTWNERIGKSQTVTVGNQTAKHKHIRKVVHGNRTRITMAGPLALKGMRNSGEYSIENLREYMLAMGKDYLTHVMEGWENNPAAQPHDIVLKIRGHSRGGVASVEGAMMIKQWLNETYPDYEKYVKFDLTQFDPVPGFGSRSGTHEKVDVKNETEQQQAKKMRALGDSAQTTVVYSIHTEHPLFFTPQQVENTDRIVITPFAHSVGLAEVDRQASSRPKDAHRATFTDAATQEAYRIGSLNELPKGVYVLDENKTLVRLQSPEQWNAIRDSVLQKAGGQSGRHDVITEAVNTWFHTAATRNAAAANPNGTAGGTGDA